MMPQLADVHPRMMNIYATHTTPTIRGWRSSPAICAGICAYSTGLSDFGPREKHAFYASQKQKHCKQAGQNIKAQFFGMQTGVR